jgi:hypothetical protein
MAIDKVIPSLLGTYVGDRVYPATLPENPTYPCITYRQLSHLAHPIVNVQYPTFQIDLWTETYAANVELADTIINTHDRVKSITDGYEMRFNYLTYTNMFDREARICHGVMDIEIFYKEG